MNRCGTIPAALPLPVGEIVRRRNRRVDAGRRRSATLRSDALKRALDIAARGHAPARARAADRSSSRSRSGSTARARRFYRCRRVGRTAAASSACSSSGRCTTARRARRSPSPDDERFTRLGRLPRQDEARRDPAALERPKGEMSLVGPRPEDPAFVELHRDEYRRHPTGPPGHHRSLAARLRAGERGPRSRRPARALRDQILPQKIADGPASTPSQRSIGMDLRDPGLDRVAVLPDARSPSTGRRAR